MYKLLMMAVEAKPFLQQPTSSVGQEYSFSTIQVDKNFSSVPAGWQLSFECIKCFQAI